MLSRKLSFFGRIITKSRECLEKKIVEGTDHEPVGHGQLCWIKIMTGRADVRGSIETNGEPSTI